MAAALESEVARQHGGDGASGPRLELDLDDGGQRLSEPITVGLFRIAQEAIRNAQEHAMAHRIELDLRFVSGEVVLEVRDGGRGFGMPRYTSELTQAGHTLVSRGSWSRLSGSAAT